MFAGPIIARELVTTPRPWRYYLCAHRFLVLFSFCSGPPGSRSSAGKTCVSWACWRGLAACFTSCSRYFSSHSCFFSAPLSTAAAVAYEKDRRTFNLLLMTSLSDTEIVVGKLVAGLLNILIILGASVGLLALRPLGRHLLRAGCQPVRGDGGIGRGGRRDGIADPLWRDRTFQSISLTILMVVFSVTGVELFSVAFPTLEFMGVPLKEVLNPYRAMIALLYPRADQVTGVVRASSLVYIGVRLTFAALIVAFGTWKLRTWNPGRSEPREQGDEAEVGGGRDQGRGQEIPRVRRAPGRRWRGRDGDGNHGPGCSRRPADAPSRSWP